MKRLLIFLFLIIASPVFAATGTIILPVQAAKLPTSNPCAIDGGNQAWRCLFDGGSTDETAIWQFRMPVNYASGPLIKLQYSMASATSGNVVLTTEVMAVSDGDTQDVDSASFDTINNSSATAVPGTAGYIDEISITLTNADSLAAGDFVLIRIGRDASDTSNDTATGDLELRNISIEYTTN